MLGAHHHQHLNRVTELVVSKLSILQTAFTIRMCTLLSRDKTKANASLAEEGNDNVTSKESRPLPPDVGEVTSYVGLTGSCGSDRCGPSHVTMWTVVECFV